MTATETKTVEQAIQEHPIMTEAQKAAAQNELVRLRNNGYRITMSYYERNSLLIDGYSAPWGVLLPNG